MRYNRNIVKELEESLARRENAAVRLCRERKIFLNFEDLHLCPELLRAVTEAGYVVPSPIQEQAVPPALQGRDILGCAQTGTGKTAAFALPILQALALSGGKSGPGRRTIRALILTPTRELALQIRDSFRTYGKYLKYSCGVVMGGVSQNSQRDVLDGKVDILVATPGRLLDLYGQKLLDLAGVEYFVLDEADRMLDMGFIHDVRRIIEIIPRQRQTLFFTATMPPEIRKLSETLLYRPVQVAVTPISSTVELTEQFVCLTDKAAKPDLMVWLLQNKVEGSALVFTRTKYGADKLAKKLKRAGIDSMAIHGDKSQGARQNALDSFKRGSIRCLVATDIAARGIDIEDLPYVVNYELPNIPETYVHRIGRTGRAGKSGVALSLCDFDEKPYLADIEKLIKKKIAVLEQPYPMTVFVKSPPPVRQPRPPRDQRNFR